MEHRGPLPDLEIPEVSLFDLIFAHLSDEDAGRPALVHPESGLTMTFGQVRDDVEAIATWFFHHGVGPGSAVAINLPNCPEYAAAFHGIVHAGAATTPVNPAYIAPEIARQLRETRARFIITNTALLPTVQKAAESVGMPPANVIVIGGGEGHTDWWELVTCPRNPPHLQFDPARHIACLPFSSGTSGLPKAVMLSHRNLVANMLQFNEILRPLGDDLSLVAFLPYSHIYGMTTNLNYGLHRRFTQYTMAGFNPQAFLGIVAQYRPSLLFVVPPVAAFLAKHPAVGAIDWSCVKLVVSGAAPLDGAVGDAIEARLGCRLVQGYGMTELSPVTHVIPLDRRDLDLGTIGLAVPNVRFRVVDPETGRDVDVPEQGPSAPGELWCTGPNAMLGYLGQPMDTDAVLDADGWVHTGDLVTVDARGAVRVVDRIKELIKRRGFQVAPVELEAILCTHPAVADAAVLGVDSSTAGEQLPYALVQLVEGAEASGSEIIHWFADQVSAHKRLSGLTFVPKVPRSAAGKILRRELPHLLPGQTH